MGSRGQEGLVEHAGRTSIRSNSASATSSPPMCWLTVNLLIALRNSCLSTQPDSSSSHERNKSMVRRRSAASAYIAPRHTMHTRTHTQLDECTERRAHR